MEGDVGIQQRVQIQLRCRDRRDLATGPQRGTGGLGQPAADQVGNGIHRAARQRQGSRRDILARVINACRSAGAGHQSVHHPASNPDRHDPRGRRQLEQEQPDTAAGAEHEQPASGGQAQPGQHEVRGSRGERRGRRVGERGRRADRRGQGGVDYRELGVPPAAVREMRHRHDPVPGHKAGNPRAHAVDDPGYVIAKDARHPQPSPAAIGPVTRIDRVDPSRMHGYPHLAGPGDRISSPARP